MNLFHKQIEALLSAVSFAEEGEFRAATEMLGEGRGVLLALRDGALDARTLKYAFHAAQRIGARLDILSVTPSNNGGPAGDPLFRRFTSELDAAGIRYHVETRTGCVKQEIVEYTRREKDILFVIVESPDSLDAECGKHDTKLADLWRTLRCPLVVVSEARA